MVKPKFELGQEVYLKVIVKRIEQSLGANGVPVEPRYHLAMRDSKADCEVLDDVLFEHNIMSQQDVVAYQGDIAGEEY